MILVTGGTGLVGSHLLYELALKNEKIRAIYRDESRIKKTKQVFSYYNKNWQEFFSKIEWVYADITDVPQLENAFNNIKTVYHCAAYISFNPKDYSLAKKINRIGTANMVNLSIAFNIEFFCHVSSIATLDETPIGITNEEANWTPEKNKHNIYAITKYQAELEVWRGTQEGLNAVIVNPGVILGPGFWNNGSGKLFKQIAKGMHYYTSGSVGFIDVRDVVKCMIKLTHIKAYNERYILVTENLSYQNFVSLALKSLKLKNKAKSISKKYVYWIWKLDSIISFFGFKKQQFYKSSYLTAFKKLEYDNTKIKSKTKLDFIPIKQSIEETARYYIK